MSKHKCPMCGSDNTRPHGTKQLHCKDCGKYPQYLRKGKRWANKKDQVPSGVAFDVGGKTKLVDKNNGAEQEIEAEVPYHMTDEDLLDYLGIDKDKYEIIKTKYTRQPIYRKDRSGEMTFTNGKMDGWSKDSGKMAVAHMYGVQVWTRRKTEEIKVNDAGEELLRKLEKKSPKVPRKKYKANKDGLMLQIMIPDIHFGRATRAEESGDDFDMKIAFSVVDMAIGNLLEKASTHKISKIFLPYGNDAFNVDNEINVTAAGTPQQEESWWVKTFTAGEALFSHIIERLTEVAPVDVMFIPGNHDPHRIWYFGRVAQALYKNNKNVSVTNEPRSRQYYNFGRNTFCLLHGDTNGGRPVKLDKLPATITFELRKHHPEWLIDAHTLEAHMGHVHHKQEMEYMALDGTGITYRFFRSLTGTDRWHFDNQFLGSPKAAEALLWTPNDGLFAQFPTTIPDNAYRN